MRVPSPDAGVPAAPRPPSRPEPLDFKGRAEAEVGAVMITIVKVPICCIALPPMLLARAYEGD
jgi:hypothetical protein